MQKFEFLRQPLLGELAMSRKKERERREEREKNAIYSGHLRLCQQPRAFTKKYSLPLNLHSSEKFLMMVMWTRAMTPIYETVEYLSKPVVIIDIKDNWYILPIQGYSGVDWSNIWPIQSCLLQ